MSRLDSGIFKILGIQPIYEIFLEIEFSNAFLDAISNRARKNLHSACAQRGRYPANWFDKCCRPMEWGWKFWTSNWNRKWQLGSFPVSRSFMTHSVLVIKYESYCMTQGQWLKKVYLGWDVLLAQNWMTHQFYFLILMMVLQARNYLDQEGKISAITS